MNTRRIKSFLIERLGDNFTAYIQALRFVYRLKTRRHSDPEVRIISRFLHRGDVAVDVGANGADWTYCLHQCIGKEGQVYAFEADPYYALATDIAIKLMRWKGVRLFCFGLSDIEEEVVLQVTDSNGLRVAGMGHVNKHAEHNEKGATVVQLKRLDSLIQEYPQILSTALIKCDVEGYELFVFKGATEVLANARPYIILEVGDYAKQGYSARDVYNFFIEHEYLPFAILEGDKLSATSTLLEHDKALSVNRILIPKEKMHQLGDLMENMTP